MVLMSCIRMYCYAQNTLFSDIFVCFCFCFGDLFTLMCILMDSSGSHYICMYVLILVGIYIIYLT